MSLFLGGGYMPIVRWYGSSGMQRKAYHSKIKAPEAVKAPYSSKNTFEEELSLSKELFYKAFQNNPNLLFISTMDGELIDVNKAVLEVIGYSWDELLNISKIQKDFCIIKEENALPSEEESGNKWVTFQTKQGQIRKGILTVEHLHVNNNTYVLKEIVDITEKNKFNQEMEHLDRLSIVGKMAAAIAHEVRNPLTTVRGFLQLLQKKQECSQYMDYFNIMIDEIDRANKIISEFLSFAGNKTKPSSKGNLNAIIEGLVPLLYATATQDSKDINVQLQEIPPVLLEESEIRQLVLNLVRNGLEAMDNGCELILKTFLEDNSVVLSIIDEGPGFSKEALENLGNPFFTTKDKGTGLGLSICYSIVRRHNAKMEIESVPGRTNVMIKFPIINN